MSKQGYCGIGLYNPKFGVNVGHVLRAMGCFDVNFLAITGGRYRDKIRCVTDTQKMYKHIPVFRVDDLKSIIPYGCVPVAVDILPDATPLPRYEHPERAFYIFGQEDGTLGKRITEWCRDIIYVPTTSCLNLAATVNIVLYDRMVKRNW